jgi:23S rRNA (cytidine1920-2'-O)/16S rRNA (cytidine1409-2'-O)-methyltransferase
MTVSLARTRCCVRLSKQDPAAKHQLVAASSSDQRLDRELVNRGFVRSRSHARDMIISGLVRVDHEVVTRPAERVKPTDVIQVVADPYVSRGAHKLSGALDDLDLQVSGRALDAGASTGGFSQVLLERGAAEVIAVDVGTGQLAAVLRDDPRVRVREQTNVRDLDLGHVGRPVDLVVADLSFISLITVLDPIMAVTAPEGRLLLLIKPQFEVGRELLGKGGVVRSEQLRQRAVDRVLAAAAERGWSAKAVVPSRLPGPAGNVEYFALLTRMRDS